MSRWTNGRRGVRLAGLASLALVVLALGCGRPPDEAWLRFLGFSVTTTSTATTTTTTTTTTTNTTVVEGELRDGTTLSATANFQNASQNVGTAGGTGIEVYRVRIDYRMSGYSPPASEYGVNLYLPALGTGKDSTASTGSLSVALAPISLKQWLINTGAFESQESKPVVDLTAHLTFYAKTDEGAELEVEGSVAIALTNTGATATASNTTVSVVWQADAVIGGADGGFVVSRTGSSTPQLEVEFTLSGSAVNGTDFSAVDSPLIIPAGSASVIFTVTALPGGTSGSKVTITLSSSTSYTVGTPSSATLKIVD